MGATEDAARGRAARPGGTDCISLNPPRGFSRRLLIVAALVAVLVGIARLSGGASRNQAGVVSHTSAAIAPEIMKTMIRISLTLIPARRAASALPPTA